MLEALLVTFREGLESFLIISVIVGYLRRTNRAPLIRGVQAGIGLSLVASAIGAWLWTQVPNQPIYEGIAALSAAVLVGLLLIQMLRMGRRMKGEIEARVERMAGGGASVAQLLGITLVTTLLVTRELMEAVFYLGVQVMAARSPQGRALVPVGAALGLVTAGLLAWYWTRYSHKLNLGIVLKVTAIFLGLFLLELLIYGIHELAESGVIEGSQGFHDATEVLGPQGAIGHWISYSLLGAPLLYLVWARLARRARDQRHPPAVASS